MFINMYHEWYSSCKHICNRIFKIISERESRSETKMGVTSAGQAAQGYHARLSRRFRAQHHWQATSGLRPVQPGPEGQNEEDRLPPAG